jgi:hypothetical protein
MRTACKSVVLAAGLLAICIALPALAQVPPPFPTDQATPGRTMPNATVPGGTAPAGMAPKDAVPTPGPGDIPSPEQVLPPLPADRSRRPAGAAAGPSQPGTPATPGPWAPLGAFPETYTGPSGSLSVNPFSIPAAPVPGTAPARVGGNGWVPPSASAAQRPFGNYRPGPQLSPYLYLYRSSPTGIDSYNLFVRPAIEQQTFNRQVETQVHTIQTEAVLQTGTSTQGTQYGNAIQMNLFPGAVQTPSAASFMNYQSYYPGFGAPRR